LLCSQLCPKLSGGLVQTVGQSGLTGWRSKEKIIDPCARLLKPRVPLFYHPEFGNQLIHNFHPEDFIVRAPKRELHGRRHRHPKRGKLSSHLGVVESSDPHPV
jgi:hypothetical protein